MILTSSAAGLKGLPFLNPYVASKHAITGLARAFAAELGMHNIRVNSLHPAGVETPMGTGDAIAALGPAMEANPRVEAMYSTASGRSETPIRATSPTPWCTSPPTRHATSPRWR